MDGFIDIYSKLIISILSFIAPVIVYLLSVFSEGITIIRRKTNEEKSQILNLLKMQVQSASFNSRDLDASNKALKGLDLNNGNRTNLLNPKKQIVRIFTPLFLALVFIMIVKLINTISWDYKEYISYTLVFLSLICFGLGMNYIKQVAWVIIETKEDIAKDKEAIPVKTQEDTDPETKIK